MTNPTDLAAAVELIRTRLTEYQQARGMELAIAAHVALVNAAVPALPTLLDALTSFQERERELVERCAQIAEEHSTCGCNGEHGTCLVDDAPKAIASSIRFLSTEDLR